MSNGLKTFGQVLIVAGVIGFIAAVIMGFTRFNGIDAGALPAVSFLFILIGIAFSFPSLLEESKGELSTMRIIVFAVVLVFCVLYIKIGWTITNLDQFSIDHTWIYILGLAFGGKAIQKFGEDNTTNNDGNNDGTGKKTGDSDADTNKGK